MADINARRGRGGSGRRFRADDVSGETIQHVKPVWGVDGTENVVSGATNAGLPTWTSKNVRSIISQTDAATGIPLRVNVKFAAVNAPGGTSTVIVAAVSGRLITVLSYVLIASAGGLTAIWQNGTGGNLSGAMPIPTGSAIAVASDFGVIQSTVASALVLNVSGAGNVVGHISYAEI